jgi:hypothetical protein
MRITLYLLCDRVDIGQIILNKAERYTPATPREPPEDVRWRLLVRQRPAVTVQWMKLIQPLLSDSNAISMSGQTAGAVLLVAAHRRSFAVTVGTGFHAVKDADIEPDFGLRVVANSVDPAKLTRAEARDPEKGAKNSAGSLPVPNAVFALDLSTDEEWIRRFGGQLEDRTFAASASGADSLQLTLREFNLADLPDKLAKILERSSPTRYQEHFPFLDYRRLLSKVSQVAQFDIQVVNQFQDAVRRKRRGRREFLHGDDLVPETAQRADRGGAELVKSRDVDDTKTFTVTFPRLRANVPILAPNQRPPPGRHDFGIARNRLPRREIADDSIGRKVSSAVVGALLKSRAGAVWGRLSGSHVRSVPVDAGSFLSYASIPGRTGGQESPGTAHA